MSNKQVAADSIRRHRELVIRKICFLSVLFFSLSVALFARGAAEEEVVKTQNDEWVLCIAAFDTSALIPERRAVSDVIMRELVERLSTINYRTRIASEYTYYEETAWSNSRASVAKALAAKQNERSLLLFKGESERTYRANLAKLDADIEQLQESLAEIDDNAPVINKEPVFKLASSNMDLRFPAAPVAGNEYRFCTSQKSDAVLIGSISDFHGRFLVTIKLYTIYTRSFVWEDRIVISHDDMDSALEEFTRRLIILLSGNKPSAITVTAQPEETLVLINKSFVSRGSTSILEYPPGRVTITASAVDYESISFETDLAPGELSKITINLKPIEYGEVEITGTHKGLSGNVYHGALYIGEAPLTLRLPANYMDSIEIEAENGEIGRVIFQTQDEDNFSKTIAIRTAKPPRQGRVNRARNMFYWSFGGTWVAGIATWITYYSYGNMVQAYNVSKNQKIYDDAQRIGDINNKATMALCALGVLDLILITRYLYVANKDSPSVKTGGN